MTRLAILGIDGATFEIINPLVAAGELPNIARLLAQGGQAVLESETPPITPPAWVSMMSGLNPGRHGVYNFVRRQLGSYQTPLNDSRSYKGCGIAEVLARRGWSSGLLNVPMTYPPQGVGELGANSFVISGIPCPRSGSSLFNPPQLEDLCRELLERDYRCDLDYAHLQGDHEGEVDDLSRYAELRDELFAIERERMCLTQGLLRHHSPDFFFTVVGLTDRCQHWFWKFQDESHPGWSEAGAKLYGETIADAYRLADEFLGMLRTEVGESVPIAIVSDHGFGPHHWDFHINKWLEQEGLLVRRKTPYWRLGHSRIAGIKIPRPRRQHGPSLLDVDWKRTKAWCSLQGICLNIVGREREGMVSPDQATAMLSEIEQRLLLLRLPDGSKAIDFFVRGHEFYSGPRVAEAPDLQFQMSGLECLPRDDWDSPNLFTQRRNAGISGTHRFPGIFAIAAPGVKAGVKLKEMHIRDTTPTILHLLGEDVPSWMEGEVRTQLGSTKRDVQIAVEDYPGPQHAVVESVFGSQESSEIEESLRGLGYL